jgi:pilus assembly protein CpaC
MRIRGRFRLWLFILLIAVTAPGVVYADDTPSVKLMVGRSAVVDIGTPIQRVSLTSPDIADAMVTSSSQLLVNGKAPGTISMFVWERNGSLRQYEIIVQRDLARLNDQIKRLFPGESIDAQSNGRSIVLSGTASSKELADKAGVVAAGYVDKAEDVVNLLKLQEGIASNQVLLRVRFAEVSRTALTELGVSLFTSPLGIHNTLGRVTTQQFAAPGFDELQWTKASSDFGADVTSAQGKFTFSDFLNLFLFSEKYDLGAMIRALSTRGLFQSLAEPNLVAESGKEASFLAGGEIPIPIAQGTGGNVAISVQYKEFGIRLNFMPTVSGSRVHLRVKPEVSTLDFANAVTLQGFRIPALSTRRTDTELELNDGQTFAIAGLLNNTATQTLSKIPGIGDIPILGLLFKSKAAQKNQTELVVMITPQILQRNSIGVTPNLPRQQEPYLPPMPQKRSFEPPPPAFTPARGSAADTSSSRGAPAVSVVNAPPPSAPARVQAGQPQTPSQGQPQMQAQPQPAGQGQPLVARPVATPGSERPLTPEEQRQIDRARAQDAASRASGTKSDKEALKSQQRTDEINRNAAKADQVRQEKMAREKTKLEKEKAERDAKAAKAAAAQAKKQAEVDRAHQKQLDEAAAEAKKAQAKYDALAKGQKQ